jgi:hypothetical protein
VDLVAVGEYLMQKQRRYHSATLSCPGERDNMRYLKKTLTSLRMRRFLRMCFRTGSGLMLS